MSEAESERFWDEKARENALYYVDNRVDYGSPDADEFWRGGDEALDRMLGAVGLTLDPDSAVVDIGCGVGRMSRALAGRVRQVHAVDVSSEMLARARELNPHLTNVEWLHGDGRSLGVVPTASVDGCFSHVVFQHVPEAEMTLSYIRDMGRVLVPGGWALFQVSMDPSVHRGGDTRPALARRLAGLVGRGRAERRDPAWWGSWVDGESLRAAARDGGLEIEQLLDEGTQYATVLARRARTG